MKNRKIISLILGVLFMFTSLAGCGEESKEQSLDIIFSQDAINDVTAEMYKRYVVAGRIDTSDRIFYSTGNVIIFTRRVANENVYSVYNIETGKEVYKLKLSIDKNLLINSILNPISKTEILKLFVKNGSEFDCQIIDGNGSVLISKNSILYSELELLEPKFYTDLLEINNEIFYLNEQRKYEKITGLSSDFKMPNITEKVGDKYYEINNELAFVNVYNEDLEKIKTISEEEKFDETVFAVLGNGNVIAQYDSNLPFDAVDFDYFDGGSNKHVFKTVIYDINNDTSKTTRQNYKMLNLTSRNSYNAPLHYDALIEGLNNVATYYSINNQLMRYVEVEGFVDNTGNLMEVSGTFNGVYTDSFLSSNKFIRETEDQRYQIIDFYNVLLGTFSKIDYVYNDIIVAEGKAYDYNLKELLDLEDFEIVKHMYNGLLVERDGYIKLISNRQVVDVANGKNLSVVDIVPSPEEVERVSFFIVYNSDTAEYIVYNDYGEKIFTTKEQIYVLSTTHNGKTVTQTKSLTGEYKTYILY